MTNERLYYTDSYLNDFETNIGAITEDGLRVRLAQTAFYPTSGGQPHDVGTLNNIAVVDVIDEGEFITHVLAAPLTDEAVHGKIDWPRRYDQMQQHTGQHLISAVFEQLFGILTLSFHMGKDASNIEFSAKEITHSQMDAVTFRATELARKNAAIGISFEHVADAQGLRKASEREGILRIVEIPGIDRSACGGTHVAKLAEVLPLQIRDVDKVHGNIRISFVCGDRAIARTQNDFRTLSQIAKSMTVAPEQVESQVAGLQQHLITAEKQNQRLELTAAERAGVDLYAATVPGDDGIRRTIFGEPVIDERARAMVKAFAGQPKAVILLHNADSVLLGCSTDSGCNAGALLKQALAKAGARGGGSATLAQGALPDGSILQELMRSLSLGS